MRSALAPRTETTSASQRPIDAAFAYFVRFYDPRKRGTWLFWTDSKEEAEKFAAAHKCYARPAKVQERSEWAAGRGLWLSEASQVVK